MKKTCNLICVWWILEDISNSIEAVFLQFQNYSKRFGFGWRCRVELNSGLTEVEKLLILQEKYNLITLTTHESRKSTYDLIVFFYLKLLFHRTMILRKLFLYFCWCYFSCFFQVCRLEVNRKVICYYTSTVPPNYYGLIHRGCFRLSTIIALCAPPTNSAFDNIQLLLMS